MAYFAELSVQTDQLVAAVTGISKENDARFKAVQEATVRSLRHHNCPPVNPFEVRDCLDGLEERFAVAGRDGLSEALHARRVVLAEHETNWTADILGFLLELSDQPTERASLDELNRLCASRIVPQSPPLRWEDIAREDGWVDELALWKASVQEISDEDDDDYDDDGDEDDDENGDAVSDNTSLSGVEAQDQQRRALRDLKVVDGPSKKQLDDLLQTVRGSQSWRRQPAINDSDDRTTISELQLLRETLFMLQGLETTLYGEQYEPTRGYRLADVSVAVYDSIVMTAAASGRRLLPLRRRIAQDRRAETVPLLQVFGEAIRKRLAAWNGQLAALQARYVRSANGGTVLVSVAAVLEELRPALGQLAALGAVVQQLDAERNPRAFRLLELLYDATALTQLDGRQALHEYFADVFFECFQVYLRPIRLWMEEGRLLEGDRIFFVGGPAATTAASTPPTHLWQHQFRLLQTSSGDLHAPRFLRPAAAAIFSAGKSIVVLRQLGRYDAQTRAAAAAAEPALDRAAVCPPGTELALFAQRFATAFDGWIQSKHQAAAATLQHTLLYGCGLLLALEALQGVYLASDGARLDVFATRLFHDLDAHSPRWQDRYALTQRAWEAFCVDAADDAPRLTAAVDRPPPDAGSDVDDPAVARRTVRGGIARVRLTYRLAWPVQIVIPPESMAAYQAVFTLLLQIRRASSFLSRHRLLEDGRQDDDGDNHDHDRHGPSGPRAAYFSLRAKLLWLCGTLQSYLATLVIVPNMAALRTGLQQAADVDGMIQTHAAFVQALRDEACLGARLQPIRDSLLDLLDLALRLEDARRAQAAQNAAQLQETWRLSVLSSPYQTPAAARRAVAMSPGDSVRRRLFAKDGAAGGALDKQDNNDDNNDDDDDSDDSGKEGTTILDRPYAESLQLMGAEFNSCLRFAVSGLRGVTRASSNTTAAAKWRLLAEMLEAGMRE